MDTQNTNHAADTVDLGPLSWVVDSLRDSLQGVREQLLEFSQEVANASGSHVTTLDTATLRMAAQSLRDCGGVLDLVERPAAAVVISAMEKAVQHFVNQPELCTAEAAATLNQAGNAVLDYVVSVSSGQADHSVGLFPIYQSVGALSDMKRTHPADLWHYKWQWLETQENIPLAQADTLAGGNVFFESVLRIFKSQGTEGIEPLSIRTHSLWLDSTDHEARVFWQLATGFLQTLAQQDTLVFDDYVKRMLSRMAVQYDLHKQNKLNVSEELAQDTLFFIALGHKNNPAQQAPVAQAVVERYQLQPLPICNYDKLLYGKIDPNIRADLRKAVVAFKELWSDISAGSVNKLDKLSEPTQKMTGYINTLWAEAQPLSSALESVVNSTVSSGKEPSADMAMEVATSVLFLEATLDDYQADDAEIGNRANMLAQRLQSVQQGNALDPLADWMEALYARLNDKDSISQAVAESSSAMGEVEQALDDFFRHPQKTEQASASVEKLNKISSVLMVLDCPDASTAVTAMAAQVQQLINASQTAGDIDSPESQDNVLRLGNSLGTLSFMLDMMGYQPDRARAQFYFDAELQELVHSDKPVKSAAAPSSVLPPVSELPTTTTDTDTDDSADTTAIAPTPAVAADDTATATTSTSPAVAADDDGIHDEPLEDEELREIFLDEAQEVIGNARTAVEALRNDFSNTEELTNLRRSFHTLKGSGRMVGLSSFGEAAWEIERMLNGWLADNQPASEPLLALCTDALDALHTWRENIANNAANPWHHSYFKAPAATMQEDGSYPTPIALAAAPTGNADDGLFAADTSTEAPSTPADDMAPPTEAALLAAAASPLLAAEAADAFGTTDVAETDEAALFADEETPLFETDATEAPSAETAASDLATDEAALFADEETPLFETDATETPSTETAASDLATDEAALFADEETPLFETDATEAPSAETAASDLATEEAALFADDAADVDVAFDMPSQPPSGMDMPEATPDSRIAETQYGATTLPEDSTLESEKVAPDAQVRLLHEQSQSIDVFAQPATSQAEKPATPEAQAEEEIALFADDDETPVFADAIDAAIAAENTPLDIESGYDKSNETVLMGDSVMPAVEPEAADSTLNIESGYDKSNETMLMGDSVMPTVEPEATDSTLNIESGYDKSNETMLMGDSIMPVEASADVELPAQTAAFVGFLVDTQPQIAVLNDMADGLPSDEIKQVAEHTVPLALFNAYIAEADVWSRQLVQETEEWSLTSSSTPAPESAANLAHSLAGSSAAVGLAGLASLSRGIEHAVNHLATRPASKEEAAVVLQATQAVRQDLHQFAAGLSRSFELGLLYQLAAIVDNQPVQGVGNIATLTPAEFAQFVQFSAGMAEKKTVKLAQIVAAAKKRDGTTARAAAPAAAVAPKPIAEPAPISKAKAEPKTEAEPKPEVAPKPQPQAETPPAPSATASEISPTADDAALFAPEPTAAEATSTASSAPASDHADTIEPELFEIFSEEAEGLLPEMSQALRQWQDNPSQTDARQSLMRLLHTFKGGARLAGAMQLGAMAHDMESSIGEFGTHAHTAEEIAELQNILDDIDSHYRALTQGSSAPVAAPTPAAIETPTAEPSASASTSTTSSSTTAITTPHGTVAAPVPTKFLEVQQVQQQQVRVRARVLDRMLSQTGEVMTSRSRLETDVQGMRQAVTDMDGSLERLRTQLRDMELQAESQMQSRMAQATDNAANFDPLEFDRFTRVQELTRMMAEAVNDVASVQRNMARAVRSTEDNLSAQARQAKELQSDLLRTRMVEFDSLSDRLYRVVRQAAKESEKQVRLEISGGTIEMDRTIIERIASPFEHLLRNAVVHGIEDETQRSQAGKDSSGAIYMSLQQDGNDVVISVRDDGRGLDIQRLRNKATSQGLLTADSTMSDEEAAQLIFHSGLSTAEAVTSLAGRGVGMDVVRSEINALGGRIEVQTQAGKGTEFTLVLPLTTAVTQVVELRAGDLYVGVPSTLVEKVERADAKSIEQAYNSQTYTIAGEKLPFYWAGAMLQHSRRTEDMAAKRQVVVVLRSASQRIVVHVDAVLGNHEVIVKNIGPQLMRMPGLSGITILPSGRLLFIYNPVALSFVYGEHIREFGADLADPSVLGAGAVSKAHINMQEPTQPTVLVVDDSITVRRVTARLLKREGYRVMLAADGLAALRELANEKPHIVLSDIEMPKMDGFDLLRNIRDDDNFKDLPVIMITSRTADKHREHAMELGATGFLGKPYPEDELLRLLHEYTQNAAVPE